MHANFDVPRYVIERAAIRAGLKLVKTTPQAEGNIYIRGPSRYAANGAPVQCTTATIAHCYSTMRLIAALAAEQKDCLISCKSIGY